jgi:Transcriptional regulator
MNEHDCRFILNLYKTKNITKTAQQNFVTQSSLTKLIQRIEAEFGCQLLLRSQKGVVFTPEGEELVHYCKKVLQLHQDLQEDLNKHRGIIGGSVAIGSSVNYCRYRLPTALKTYISRYPVVDISIVTGHSRFLYNNLLENKIAVAIIRGEFKWDEGLLSLSSEPMCLVYSNTLAERSLFSYPYVCHRSDVSEQYDMDRWANENGINTHNTSIWIDDITGCMEMAQAGVGWTILPAICLDHFQGVVKPLFFKDGTPLTRNTYVMYRKAQYRLPQVKRFIDTLLENERSCPYAVCDVSPSTR